MEQDKPGICQIQPEISTNTENVYGMYPTKLQHLNIPQIAFMALI